MGILNVTPDSFSDGGQYFDSQCAIDRALRMEDDGADILDIGGESTRPYADPVSIDEELRRVLPVIEVLVDRVSIPLSIDTSKSAVANAAIGLGAEIINDVTGLEGDPAMAEVASCSKAGICAMHMQGSPQMMQDAPHYENVVGEIFSYLQQRDTALQAAGISSDRICLDPGIGFGKTHSHNIELVNAASQFTQLNRPILIGHSRKGFIGKLLGDKEVDRMAGTLAISLILAQQGVHILRVHDVAQTKQALRCLAALNA